MTDVIETNLPRDASQTSGLGGAGYNSPMRTTEPPDVASYSYAGAGYASPDAVSRPIPTPPL
jgi:hypothetical protein